MSSVFRIRKWDLSVHMGQRSYSPAAFLEAVDHSRIKMRETCLIITHNPGLAFHDYKIRIPIPINVKITINS